MSRLCVIDCCALGYRTVAGSCQQSKEVSDHKNARNYSNAWESDRYSEGTLELG
jgi:hypothetical protein